MEVGSENVTGAHFGEVKICTNFYVVWTCIDCQRRSTPSVYGSCWCWCYRE